MADNNSNVTGFLNRAKEWADACEFSTVSEMLSALIDKNPKRIATAFKNLFTSVGQKERRSFKDRYGIDASDLYTEVVLSSSSTGDSSSSSPVNNVQSGGN